MKACCKKPKLLHLPIYNTEFRIYNIYISGPPYEEKNPPSSGSAYGLEYTSTPAYLWQTLLIFHHNGLFNEATEALSRSERKI